MLNKLLDTDLYDTNFIDKYERSPIFYSVLRGDYKMAKAFVKKASFLDFEDVYQKVLIDYARDGSSPRILKLLVESGATLGKSLSKGIELLFLSVEHGWNDLFKILIKKGVPIGSINKKVSFVCFMMKTGDNVLMLSHQMKNTEVFDFIVQSSETLIFSRTEETTLHTILIKVVLAQDLDSVKKILT